MQTNFIKKNQTDTGKFITSEDTGCYKLIKNIKGDEMVINKKRLHKAALNFCGPDGTRTRDPMRDRHVF